MRTCVCILAGTKACEKCQNSNNTGNVSTWTGSGNWTWKKPEKDKNITTTKKSDKMDTYKYLCLFIDYLKQKEIIPLAMFQDEEDYLKLKKHIEDFVNEDYSLNPYMYRRIKSAWKNKYGERWE